MAHVLTRCRLQEHALIHAETKGNITKRACSFSRPALALTRCPSVPVQAVQPGLRPHLGPRAAPPHAQRREACASQYLYCQPFVLKKAAAFQCKYCERGYNRNDALLRHMRQGKPGHPKPKPKVRRRL